jgi:hypothetical protein
LSGDVPLVISLAWRLSLLDVCSASAILLVQALVANSGISDTTSFSTGFATTLEKIWEKMMATIKNETVDPSHRRRALTGCLEILSSLISAVLRLEKKVGGNNNHNQCCLLCAKFLDDFADVETPPSVLLTSASLQVRNNEDLRIDRNRDLNDTNNVAGSIWLLSCQYEAIEISLTRTVNGLSRGDGSYNIDLVEPREVATAKREGISENISIEDRIHIATSETRAKSHLLLALPAIITLLGCESYNNDGMSRVRAAACRAISSMNMDALMRSYSSLEEKADRLQTENTRLLSYIEQNSINSTAVNLPY